MTSISLGIIFGIILNISGAGHVFSSLVTLPGPLFLRALQCAVIPMMFFNISVSVAQIYGEGGAGSLGKKVLKFYLLTTVAAVMNGIAMANIFASLFTSDSDEDDDDGVDVEFKCPKGFGKITVDSSGNVLCMPTDSTASYNISHKYQEFSLQDEENLLINTAIVERTLLDQVLSTAYSLVPSNFTESFAGPNIISVIVIAMVMGMAMVHIGVDLDTEGKGVGPAASPELELDESDSDIDQGVELQLKRNPSTDSIPKRRNSNEFSTKAHSVSEVLELFKECTVIANLIIKWIVELAPYCIAFLIAGSLAEAGNLVSLMRSVGVYVAATFVGIVIHVGITLPTIFFIYTRENPYQWMFACRRAMLVALSTASSAATLPITIRTVVDTGLVSETIANVILPMGANINMDGTGVGFPCVIMFLAYADHYENKVNAFTWVNVALGSTLGSVGAAPVPSAGLVTMITVWQTAFPNYDVPSAIAYVQAIDFLIDRIQTMTNVVSDMFVVRMLQVLIDSESEETFSKEKLESSTSNPMNSIKRPTNAAEEV
eukprot:CAMPEP_0185035952 /NCGR_PEP_ID=MMETSP1103-20130426/28164_1 /TAXON_ID=36769 /ORGANISM="Paraphysomonas bandaiensis, Strain Caron Lab Isolate" /LENGTH=544 /DNA_ID=CAMNT_0027573271 /DNA_START=85 /DNA_END=1719 /DNA_ORIENTATION=-